MSTVLVGIVAAALSALAPFPAHASGQAYAQTELTAQVDELFAQWDTENSPGAAVGIFKDGRIVYARGYGVANLDYGIPLVPQSVLRIGSISKQFVGMCIAILVEQGKLSLDDDICAYLPEMPDYGEPITIRHLLHHTSGIREYLTLVGLIGKPEGSGFGYTTRELVDLLARQQELNFSPGTRFSYTNSGYFLLAEIVTRVTGMRASAFAQENVFDPLGMKDSRFYDDRDAIIRNQSMGYSTKPGGGYRLDILRSEVIGDLGVITTIEDFLRWDNNFYDNQLGAGTPVLIEAMSARGRTNDGEELSYAFGLEFGSYRGLRTMGHGGSAVGYVADFMQFPDQRFSVVILSNLSSFRPGRLARQIADLYLADQFTEALVTSNEARSRPPGPEAVTLPIEELEAFAGDFYSDELDFYYSLQVREGSLQVEVRGNRTDLVPYSGDRFGWGRRELTFLRNDNGGVSGFTLDVGIVRNLRFRRVESRVPSAADSSGMPAQQSDQRVAFTKKVDVLGVPIYATNTTGDDKLLHAAGVLAQYIDNDEDGEADNPLIMAALLGGGGAIVMTKTQGEMRGTPRGSRPRGQGLYDEETRPNAKERGVFDTALEEILHMVSDVGWGGAYPRVFGRVPGTEIANAMDLARGGRFEEVPDEYPAGAWYSYDDRTCDYDCMASEYIYWAFTSFLGAQDIPGRFEQVGHEWKLTTRALLQERDPAVYAIVSNPEYKFPSVAPDGKYTGRTLAIEPYEHR